MALTTPPQAGSGPRRDLVYEHDEHRAILASAWLNDHENAVTAATLTGGSSVELAGGGVAIVLAIIGLAGYQPLYMTAIATIAIGIGLLAHGAAASARWQATIARARAGHERLEVAGGLGSEVFGGACAVALGILSLAAIVPSVLLPVAAIVLGASILLSAPAQPELARLAPDIDRRVGRFTYQAVERSTGAMVLIGTGAVVLGILALIHVGPALTLSSIALLAIGGALFLGGTTLAARFARRLRQTT